MEPTSKWDQSAFDRSLNRYALVCKSRTFPEILNTKGYFIARATTRETGKADAFRIRAQLGQTVRVNYLTKKGKVSVRRVLTLPQGTQHEAPLAALIINARRGRAGEPGLAGKPMDRAIRQLIGARIRSVSFIKAGWIPAIKKFAPLAAKGGAPAMDTSAREFGRPKGDATPAKAGWNIHATLLNLAFGNRTSNRSRSRALAIGTRGLQRGMDLETASMNAYVEARMKPDAVKFNQENK